jgi:hypothetical protein
MVCKKYGTHVLILCEESFHNPIYFTVITQTFPKTFQACLAQYLGNFDTSLSKKFSIFDTTRQSDFYHAKSDGSQKLV